MKQFLTRLKVKNQLSKGSLIKIKPSPDKDWRMDLLIEKSLKNDSPILVGNQTEINMYKQKNPSVEVLGYAPNFTKHIYNGNFPNGVLIDESVNTDLVEYLQKAFPNAIKIQGGFINEI